MDATHQVTLTNHQEILNSEAVNSYLIGTKKTKIYKGLKVFFYASVTIFLASSFIAAQWYLYFKYSQKTEMAINQMFSRASSQLDKAEKKIEELQSNSHPTFEGARELGDINLPLLYFYYLPIELMKEIPSIVLEVSRDKFEYFKIEAATKDFKETILHLSNSKSLIVTNDSAILFDTRTNRPEAKWEFGVDYLDFIEEIKEGLSLEEQEMLSGYLSMPKEDYQIGLDFVKEMPHSAIKYPIENRPIIIPRIPDNIFHPLNNDLVRYHEPMVVSQQPQPIVANLQVDGRVLEEQGIPSMRGLKESNMTIKEKSWDKKMAFFSNVAEKFINKAYKCSILL